MSEPEIPWSQYEKAYKNIHDAIISSISSPPAGKKITRFAFTWNADSTLSTLRAYHEEEVLFILSFEWNGDGTLRQVSRS